eukprot:scaffold118297_cov27-Tisochrysis_lutea.AAC.1
MPAAGCWASSLRNGFGQRGTPAGCRSPSREWIASIAASRTMAEDAASCARRKTARERARACGETSPGEMTACNARMASACTLVETATGTIGGARDEVAPSVPTPI